MLSTVLRDLCSPPQAHQVEARTIAQSAMVRIVKGMKMTQQDSAVGKVAAKAHQAAQDAVNNEWFERLAHLGYAAKGIVYLVAGAFSARAAFGLGGATTDTRGALQRILTGPFGKIALGVIAVGLVGYVLLRLVQAFMDPERKGTDPKGLAIRAGYVISAAVYASLALTAVRLANGSGASSGNPQQSMVARVFALPLGRWLVGIGGLIVIGGGLYQLYKAYSSDFSEHMIWDRMSATERRWAPTLGRIGLASRGIVQLLVGWFITQAAITFDLSKVQSSGGALQSLARPPFGLWTVGVVAVGLAAYGVYMLTAARYARIVTR
jgi:hypothetical protein